MQKIKNPILCWIVILAVFIRPVPAQAFLPAAALVPVAVGALISGTLVAGSGIYSQASYDAAKVVVDGVTGAIDRKVVQAVALGSGVNQVFYGGEQTVKLGYDKVVDWVKAHPIDFPNLLTPVNASLVESPPNIAPGFVYAYGGSGNFTLTTNIKAPIAKSNQSDPTSAYPISLGGNARAVTFYWNGLWQTNIVANIIEVSPSIFSYDYSEWMATSTLLPVQPLPVTRTPALFAPSFAHSPETEREIDKLIWDNPAVVDSKPIPFTPDQLKAPLQKEVVKAKEREIAEIEALPPSEARDIELERAKGELEAEKIKEQVEDSKAENPPDVAADPLAIPLEPPPALNFQPLYSLKDQAVNKYPFNILSSLSGYFNCLVAPAKTPELKMNNGFGQEITMTMASWDGTATMLRGFMLLFFNAACMYGIVRRWS